MLPCNLCRTLTVESDLSGGVCSVCSPWWPSVRSKIELTPSWQKDAEECKFSEDIMKWIEENNFHPDDEGWAHVLSRIMEDVNSSELLDEWNDSTISLILPDIKNVIIPELPLFQRGINRIQTSHQLSSDLRFGKIMDTEVLYDDGVLRIDGHKIAYGPGNLLMRFLLEKRNDPGGRFSRVMQQLLGLSANDLSQRDRLPETGSDRKWEGGFRLAGSVRPFLLGSEFNLPDPPFDWSPEGFDLVVLDNERNRHRMPLPKSSRAIEHFTAIWNGRDGSRLAKLLRGISFRWAMNSGIIQSDIVANPTERSFQLLRTIVDSMPYIQVDGFQISIIGTSGVEWRISAGIGVHGAPYVVRPVGRTPQGNPVLFREVCVYDDAEHLPIGDRIATMALGLMNDEDTSKRVDTVRLGIQMVTRHFSESLHKSRQVPYR